MLYTVTYKIVRKKFKNVKNFLNPCNPNKLHTVRIKYSYADKKMINCLHSGYNLFTLRKYISLSIREKR